MAIIDDNLYNKLVSLGIINTNIRSSNIGSSDYSKHIIQPWSIWLDYNLDPWDADIVKRVLRTKKVEGKTPEESRIEDYQKIIHICKEKLRQLGAEEKNSPTEVKLNQIEVGRLYTFIGSLEGCKSCLITIKQEPTGIGMETTVNSNGKEQDITDYEAW